MESMQQANLAREAEGVPGTMLASPVEPPLARPVT